MTLIMQDTAVNSQFRAGADAYAAYVDGGVGDQPNYGFIVATFPGAHHLSIALYAAHDADVLDVERYAASPGDVPGWHARQVRRGIARPCVYASVSVMRGDILPLLARTGISRKDTRLWSAHYGAGQHICGPGTCNEVPAGMDGTQWAGAEPDLSLLHDDFFGTAVPADANWTEFDMARLRVLKLGDTDKPGEFWAVRRLQTLMNLTDALAGIPGPSLPCAADGVFGPATDAAVRAVQAHYRIGVDGIAGAATWSVLLTGTA